MSSTGLERLTSDLQRNPDLLQELSSITDPDQAVLWARNRGYEVTSGEMREVMESNRMLSDEELEHAAGGEGWGDGTGGDGGGG